jgi:PAS domain S-box-containing protein
VTRSARRADSAGHFRLMAEYAPVMIWLAGPDRKCVYVNRLWLSFTGRALESELGSGWIEGLHPEDRAPFLALFERSCEERAPFEAQHRVRRRDGAWRRLQNHGVPLVDEGRLAGFVGSCVDVTDRLLAEQGRAELLERERSARAHAESATLARDQFLAIVSHELRSPLNGIKSWTHVLENQLRSADPAVQRALAGIMIGVEHQVRLIDDLLDVTRAMSGNLGLAKQPMELLPVLADAVESLRAMALEKGLRIVTDFSIADREIHGDPDRIRQIFVNLLSNAVKFTPSGGAISVSARPDGVNARIEVRDDGVGIPAEFLPYLFDPFRQAEPESPSRGHEGLGLGLALVQRLAELHGGRVTCESEGLGRGAAFTVFLPLRRNLAGRVIVEPDAPGDARPSALPSLAGIRVLLIDDQREARESLATLLAQSGAHVATAASGLEALQRLQRGGETGVSPEVIVCDIAMPDQDGYQTLKRIREWESRQGAQGSVRRPAVALSAFTQREDRIRALSEGFQMHLTKPVAPAELIIVISSVARGMRV